ncbi:ATP-dependent helicase [Erythrobacter sp. MTPC3]|uniref:ATP-dependent helicase n=1 Tax=Erythrobacter sp. MTPC3 TaxID=3056564 RepID=UPI0036F4441F
MSDETVAEALRSTARLVVVEAPGGCGKTYQGAQYARDVAPTIGSGRLLIVTHTNAACDVFAERTKGLGNGVEIRTIDGLITEIAGAYHQCLGLPADVGAWARNEINGYDDLANRTALLLTRRPMIATCLARRYPIMICDEHQDACASRHAVIMCMHEAGSMLRVFADPMQMIFAGSAADAAAAKQRWDELKAGAERLEELDTPHRWTEAQPALGEWILNARAVLRDGGEIDLSSDLPTGLSVHYASNTSPQNMGFRIAGNLSQPIYACANADSVLVLTGHRKRVTAIRAFLNRRLPIWEGHVRDSMASLIAHCKANGGNPGELAQGMVTFMGNVGSGFSPSAFGNRFIAEAQDGCSKACTGKPHHLQSMARHIVETPDHRGVADALKHLRQLIASENSFASIRIDYAREFGEAIQLGRYENADVGFAEIANRRSHARPKLPSKAISTIHKAKGLEFDSVLLMPCDKANFGNTMSARSKLYVALSRATTSLTLVLSKEDPSPLFKL